MFLKLRLVFTVLSAICIAAVLPIGAFLDLTWALITAAGAFIFFLLMMLCKQEQEKREPLEPTLEQSPTHNDKKDE